MSAASIDSQAIPRKTHAGAQAVATRDANLPTVLRRLLLLTDGKRNAFTLAQLLPDVNVQRALAELSARGLVDMSGEAPAVRKAEVHAEDLPEGWMEASEFMMSRARESLGVAAVDVIDRIEHASDTDAAREAMSQWYRAMRSSRNGGRVQADQDRLKVVSMLGRV